MTRREARELLDAVRAGGDATEEQITAALRESGDLAQHAQIISGSSVDNFSDAEIRPDTLDRLIPTASPAETPDDALNPAGVPPLPRSPGRRSMQVLPSSFLPDEQEGNLRLSCPKTLARVERESAR